METYHRAKKRSTSLVVLKLIAQKRANKKSQLEELKIDFSSNLTAKISQIYKAYKDAIEAQQKEMKKKHKQFQFEIEMLEKRILKLKKKKKKLVQRRIQ